MTDFINAHRALIGFALAFAIGFALAITSPPLWWWRAMATPLMQLVARLS